MRYAILILSTLLLTGCAGSPPKPPAVKGEYRPVNHVEALETTNRKVMVNQVFDFYFKGDIVASLDALRVIQPQLNVLPPLGKVSSLPIQVNLRGTTLDNALRTIGEQGSDVAEVVLNTTKSKSGDQVFIRFRAPY